MKLPMHNKIRLIAGLFIMLGVGFGMGWISHNDDSGTYSSVREFSTNYKFITPLLFVKTPEEDSSPAYRSLKNAITGFTNQMIEENKVADISVYFRNLNTSQWVGVNTEKRFAPASMLKVVTLIGILRTAEENPQILTSTIKLPPANKLPAIEQEEYGPKNPLVPNSTYTVAQLIESMIIDSDNTADYALRSIVGDEKMNHIYDDLELQRPGTSADGYTAQEYSRLFRTLYNATYLSHSLSEQVLESLTKTNFTQGLVQGVPQGTLVAHKFGVRSFIKDEGKIDRELHDCGIIYYPNHPYFLCVMTRGGDFSVLEEVLKEVSELVWKEVPKLH